MSNTIPTQIRIDVNTKKEANELFKELGTDISSAVNMFLRQCVIVGGIPFSIKKPRYKEETEKAIEEARQMAKDSNAPGYNSFAEYKEAMEEQ